MARRHRHMVGCRILLVLVIPSMYFLCVSISQLIATESGPENQDALGSRKLLWMDSADPLLGTANCSAPAIQEFPPDGFTREQRQHGFVAIHFAIASYLFLLLAVVCDDFFVPSIKMICDKLGMTEDVAGATFMAAATSSPELFINIVGTFVTEGDLGVGTIVGSAVFNILAVPACCGLFATQVLKLDWWPISRDSLAYAVTVVLLILTLRDGRIEWYEALILVIFYLVYICAMIFNRRLGAFIKGLCGRKTMFKNLSEESPLLVTEKAKSSSLIYNMDDDTEEDEIVNLTQWPEAGWEKVWWFLTWPINLMLLITVPDCRRPSLRTWYPYTFAMCIVWIGSMSYIVSWLITIIGDTLEIPDSVMGLTFLAAGMSVPEAVSSVIVTNQGHGSMGISNSIGSNIFDVLLCLGLPWFVKAAFLPQFPGENFVKINSEGLVYSSVSLLSTLVILYGAFICNKFKLDRKVGIYCLVMYAAFLILASLIELNIFFPVNLPTCIH
ncbi:sodium/potassium/calcium exchanger 4-like isoform X1 [Neodiprion fabricii]|uniref:sodium/potassium/calcium exchanger 4-like isoform X1 n=1 Tax=Neodiprion fabricii TaxID=2872261 RepID=UPI001ED8C813|nr:sodium/potassium/calcium exchanger 4-like isoform X1 [Neodiprion fabricii]